MNLFKKLILPLLLLPILFFVVSTSTSNKAYAAAQLNIKVVNDSDNDHVADTASVDSVYSGSVKLTLGSNTTISYTSSTDNPVKLFSLPNANPSNLTLNTPTTSLSYIKVTDKNGTKTYTATNLGSSRSVGFVPAPGTSTTTSNTTIIYGLKVNPTSCSKAPALSLVGSPDNNSDNVVYTLKLVNNNSISCAYTLSHPGNLPTSGGTWHSTFKNSSGSTITTLNVSANNSSTFKMTITRPTGATVKTYDISARANNANANSNTLNVKYVVSNPDNNGGGGNNTCNSNPPTLTVTDPTNKTRTGTPGSQKEYTLKVTNKDTGDCPARTFVLSKESLPTDTWKDLTSFSANNFSLAKGASKESVFKVKSPATATNGEKNISIGLRKSTQTSAQVKVNLTYVVKAAGGVSPVISKPTSPTTCVRKDPIVQVTQDKNAVKPNGQIVYTLIISNNDSAKCADKVLKLSATTPTDSWTKTFSKNSLTLKPGGNTSVTLTVDSPASAIVGTKDVKLIIKNSDGTTLVTKPLNFVISENPGGVTPPISPAISGTVTPNPSNALLNFILGLDGIGTTERINIGGNKNPIETTKNLSFQLRNPLTNAIVFDSSTTNFPLSLGYESTQEKYITAYALPSSVPNGTYNVFVLGAPYISKRYPVSVNVTKGQTTNLNSPQFYMVAGNVDDEGQSHDFIDIRDYNVLMSCSIFSKDSTVCDSNANFLLLSDLNSDGLVDQSDYTLWLKEKSKQKGDLPE